MKLQQKFLKRSWQMKKLRKKRETMNGDDGN